MGSANEQSSSGWTWSTTLVVLLISYPFLQSLYYLYLHPLSRIPGSPLWSSSRLPFLVSVARGNLTRDLAAMHKRYGPILRIAPDEVTFTHPDAWNDIMVPQPGRAPFLKHPIWWKPLPGTPPSLISSIDPEQHAHFRRCFAPAFTSRALRSQEPVLQEYVDLLMRRLRDQIYDGDAKPGEERKEAAAAEVDIWRWYNFFTFDAFSHLALGESFNCLDRGAYHGWIVLIFDYAKALAALVAVRFFPIPGTDAFLSRLLPPSIVRAQQAHFQLIVDRVRRRLDRGGDPARPDVMSFLHIEGEGHDDEAEDIAPSADDDGYGRDKKEKLTLDVVNASFSELVLAGSESTGLVLTGAVNYLIHNPDKLAVVVDEVRARFASYQDITFDALRDAAYLNAVLSEALRLCPTLQWISPRQVPKGGATVCGRWLPGGVSVLYFSPRALRLLHPLPRPRTGHNPNPSNPRFVAQSSS